MPLLFTRGNYFIHFHSRQGLLIWFWGVVTLILLPLPLGSVLFTLSSIFIMVFSGVGLASVFFGQTWRLPVIYELAEKFWPSMATIAPTFRNAHGSIQRGRHA